MNSSFESLLSPVYIIAEAGVNHNGSLARALNMVDVAAQAGADAIKFQSFNPEALVSPMADKADYQKKYGSANESQLNMLKKLALTKKQQLQLATACHKHGIDFLSSPFDMDSASFLMNEIRPKFIKVASGEITNGPLLYHITQHDYPMVLSTGMSSLEEVKNALALICFCYLNKTATPTEALVQQTYQSLQGKAILQKNIWLLHCTTEYPCPFEHINLRAIKTLQTAFQLSTGLSDHSNGHYAAIAAVAIGATIIEKHFTLDKALAGPDHQASLEPQELASMVNAIRITEISMGNAVKQASHTEQKNKSVARKSLVAACDIKQGEAFTLHNLTTKRPGHGISPMEYWNLLGKTSTHSYTKNDLIKP